MAPTKEIKPSILAFFNETKPDVGQPLIHLQNVGMNFGKRDSIFSTEITSQEKVFSIPVRQNYEWGNNQQLTHLLCFFATVALSFLTVCGVFATIYFLLQDPGDEDSEKESNNDGSMHDFDTSDDDTISELNKFPMLANMKLHPINYMGRNEHAGRKQDDTKLSPNFQREFSAVELPLLDGLQKGVLSDEWNEPFHKYYSENNLIL